MDALDKLIATEAKALADLSASYNAQKIKVDALMAAAAARPAPQANRLQDSQPKSGAGKPKGAISVAWRMALEKLYQSEQPATYLDFQHAYEAANDKKLDMSSIRDRVRNFVATSLLTGDPENGFSVTDIAVTKFSFSKPSGASEGNGSHGSDASEPSAQDWDVSPSQSSIWLNPQSGSDS